jgi:hypothetical protein
MGKQAQAFREQIEVVLRAKRCVDLCLNSDQSYWSSEDAFNAYRKDALQRLRRQVDKLYSKLLPELEDEVHRHKPKSRKNA